MSNSQWDKACPYCKHYGTDVSDDPCYTCKELIGLKPSNYETRPVPIDIVNRSCATCAAQVLDRDVEPCLSCDPKTMSNYV